MMLEANLQSGFDTLQELPFAAKRALKYQNPASALTTDACPLHINRRY